MNIIIRNIRSELGLTEIEAIFSAFGAIVSSSFTGEIKSTSAGVSAREALIEFETATSATDAVSMHGTDLVGLILSVELQSAAASAASSSDTKVVSSSAEAYSSFRALKLENLVTSVDEIFEDDFQEDIIEEASRYGPLETPELRVNVGDADVTKLTRDLFLSLGLTATHEAIAVYLQFQDCSGASKAYKAMNGRHFAGQTIKATLCNFDS